MLDDVRMLLRFQGGLRQFLKTPLTFEAAEAELRRYRERREQSFLELLRVGVFPFAHSPWRKLLQSASIQFEHVEAMVHKAGLEGALCALYDAGVYCTVAEAKGKQPIMRNGLEVLCRPEAFDNPSLAGSFEINTSGSSGTPRRLLIDFALLDHDVNAQRVFLRSFGLEQRPTAIWRPVPPGGAGLKRVLLQQKCATPAQRWFSQTNPRFGAIPFKSWMFLNAAAWGSRAWGAQVTRARFPRPEYVPLSDAGTVAAWLAERKRAGACAHLDTIVSSAIRVCQAADEYKLDIAGTFFRVGSESLTESRAAAIREAGAAFACHYSMSETGPVGMACAEGRVVDDVHLLEGKLAVLGKPGPCGESALYLTTLLPGAPRIMINVESGDSAVIESRRCGCAFGSAGYQTHLGNIRSYEKVSAEGMYYLGADLTALVEEFLPAQFGGAPTDYQFVHEEIGGLNRIVLWVAPSVGELDERHVCGRVLDHLAARSRGEWMKAQIWSDGDALTLRRALPHATAGQKIPAVRFVRG